jgi:enterochelin esterase-like enzyme
MPWAPDLPFPVPSFLVNSELNGDHETAFVEDLVPWVDSTYRTIANRNHRFVFGRSAGGYGAARVALRHPDLFGGLGTQVGVIAIEVLQGVVPMLLAEYPAGPPYDFTPIAGQSSMFFFSWCAALTPNPTNPPWSVDLWVDQDGNMDTEVWQRFVSESNSRWAAELVAAGDELDIFMDGGDQDFWLPFTTVFADALDAVGLPYTLQVFAGDHDTPMATRLRNHVTFFMPMLATAEPTTTIFNPRRTRPEPEFVIELPGGLGAELFDADTIAVTEIDGVELSTTLTPVGSVEIGDANGNGRSDLRVGFSAQSLIQAMIEAGVDTPGEIRLTLRGETTDDLFWEGDASLFVVRFWEREARRFVPIR